ncbi:MAG: MmgE/PrpD family protein [Rhizobiales bacterium]|nr:MmgE/PrpD family protein [Hyphomicrobiales bacterium]
MSTQPATTIAGRIGKFASDLKWEKLSTAVQDRVRDRVMDAIATAVAGNIADPYLPVAAIMVDEPAGTATVLATGQTASPGAAAFANGVATHALLYEDLNLTSADHPGAVIIPAALAAAETMGNNATLADFLVGVLAGYEVQLFLGATAATGVIQRGFRTTSVFGTVAAAVAAATVWRSNADRIAAAATIGANFACGLTEGWGHGTSEPYFQAGIAAQNGLLAARLAIKGAQTAAPTFESTNGFLHAFADTQSDEAIHLVDTWRILNVICKPYPCSGGKIGAIDSALVLRENGIDPAQIHRVRVWLPSLYYGYPGASRTAPFASMSQAQASGQFCVAATLLGYRMQSVETFTRDFASLDIAALSHRIELLAQSETSLARVEVELNDGRTLAAQADRRNQLIPSITSMSKKLRSLTKTAWKPGGAARVIDFIKGPGGRPVNNLSACLRARI